MIEAAGALLRLNADQAMAMATASEQADTATRARWRRDAAFAADLCRRAVTGCSRPAAPARSMTRARCSAISGTFRQSAAMQASV